MLVTLLARLRPERRTPRSALPDVALLIAAYNEERVIAEKLENSLALDYPPGRLHIAVAADGSDDATADIVRGFAGRGVRLFHRAGREGKVAALNRAMESIRQPIVVFSDANSLYERGALLELVAPFADPGVGVVAGAKRVTEEDDALSRSEGLYWRYESFIKRQESRLGSNVGAAGEIMAMRRELFVPPPSHIINDDFYLAARVIRQGYRVHYAPGARSFERASASVRDERTRRSRVVAGRYQALRYAHQLLPFARPLVLWQMVSHKMLRPLVPFAMIGALLASLAAVAWPPAARGTPILRLAAPWNWITLTLQAVFYGLALVGSAWRGGGWLGRLLYLPTFLVNSNLSALAGLLQFLRNRRTHLWTPVPRR